MGDQGGPMSLSPGQQEHLLAWMEIQENANRTIAHAIAALEAGLKKLEERVDGEQNAIGGGASVTQAVRCICGRDVRLTVHPEGFRVAAEAARGAAPSVEEEPAA